MADAPPAGRWTDLPRRERVAHLRLLWRICAGQAMAELGLGATKHAVKYRTAALFCEHLVKLPRITRPPEGVG